MIGKVLLSSFTAGASSGILGFRGLLGIGNRSILYLNVDIVVQENCTSNIFIGELIPLDTIIICQNLHDSDSVGQLAFFAAIIAKLFMDGRAGFDPNLIADCGAGGLGFRFIGGRLDRSRSNIEGTLCSMLFVLSTAGADRIGLGLGSGFCQQSALCCVFLGSGAAGADRIIAYCVDGHGADHGDAQQQRNQSSLHILCISFLRLRASRQLLPRWRRYWRSAPPGRR